jgi:hypothetical protein
MPHENRSPTDPRTVARDIPGILDALFPQLTPGVVAHFNRMSYRAPDCTPVPYELVAGSDLQRSMLFELAIVAGEKMIAAEPVDWNDCLKIAVERQRQHFDARLPEIISSADLAVAQWVALNLVKIVNHHRREGEPLVRSPEIPGYQWIASGVGDISIGTRLIEVKCTNKHFSSSDYRQVIMYWLLSYASSLEKGATEWTGVILVNPRMNFVLDLPFDQIVRVTGAGRSKVELLELFSAMVADHTDRLVAEHN